MTLTILNVLSACFAAINEYTPLAPNLSARTSRSPQILNGLTSFLDLLASRKEWDPTGKKL
jgi:hypothetical protein